MILEFNFFDTYVPEITRLGQSPCGSGALSLSQVIESRWMKEERYQSMKEVSPGPRRYFDEYYLVGGRGFAFTRGPLYALYLLGAKVRAVTYKPGT